MVVKSQKFHAKVIYSRKVSVICSNTFASNCIVVSKESTDEKKQRRSSFTRETDKADCTTESGTADRKVSNPDFHSLVTLTVVDGAT